MIDKVFVDCDICLDLLTARLPHYQSAARLFSLSETEKINLSVSALTIANVHYLLLKTYSRSEAKELLTSLRKIVTTLTVTDQIIELARNLFLVFQQSNILLDRCHDIASDNRVCQKLGYTNGLG